VKAVRSGHPAPGTLRIVFDLTGPVVALKPHFEPGADGPRLVLEWPGDGAVPALPVTAVAAAQAAVQPARTPTPDPAVASSAATSRLIASLPVQGSTPAPVQRPASTPVTAAPAASDPARILSGNATAGASPAQAPAVVPGPAGQPPVKTMQDIARRAGMRPLVIAIDAGHGGQDPGARGANGSREKDITL
jgi:N-acetylmuramoyl-L-alanine amidase